MQNKNILLKKVQLLYSKLIKANLTPIDVPSKSEISEKGGVYIIIRKKSNKIYYIGKSKNLRTRICKYHTRKCKGAFGRYLVRDKGFEKHGIAKKIRSKFNVIYIIEEKYKIRGLLESYATALLNPKYGIEEEH